jgi:hypothetical protein
MRKFFTLACVLALLSAAAVAVTAPPYGFFPTPNDLIVRNAVIDGTLTVAGVTHVDPTQNTQFDGTLGVTGNATFTADILANGNITGDGATVIKGVRPGWIIENGAARVMTTADCGQVIYATLGGVQTFTLPAASNTACTVTFIAGNAGGEILIDTAADGDGCQVFAFSAIGADADASMISKADCTPGIKNTAATNALGDNVTLMANGGSTWIGIGTPTGVWATQ